MSEDSATRCPVCGSPFRGRADCPRCGADLRAVMRVQIAAWRLRNRAREALRSGDARRAVVLAAESVHIHATPAARDLAALAGVVAEADALAAEQARTTRLRALEDEARKANAARAAALQARDRAVAALEAATGSGDAAAGPPVEPTPALAEGSTAAEEKGTRRARSTPIASASRSKPSGPTQPARSPGPARRTIASRPSRPAPSRPAPWFRRLWNLWRGRRAR